MTRAAAAAVLAALTIATLQAADPLDAVVARAAAYVDRYQRDFAMVVSEERYDQEARYPAAPMSRIRDVTTRTTLRSDFLLVSNAAGGWLPFRDVFEQDGMPVRDRDERLSKLFLTDAGSAVSQAGRIVEESARYNLGSLNRNINLPTLALVFLTDAQRHRFAFSDGGLDGRTRVVQFQETGRPTYVSTTGGRDLPISGRYWVDEASGRIERSELVAVDAALDAKITVTYRADESAGLWVPAKMEELYKQQTDRSEIRGVASYSRFRRFQVKTTEDIAKEEVAK